MNNDDDGVAQDDGHTPAKQRQKASFLILGIYILVKLIDTWQIKVYADQYHLTILQAQVLSP